MVKFDYKLNVYKARKQDIYDYRKHLILWK